MLNSHQKGNLPGVCDGGLASARLVAAEPSIATLALRIVGALFRLGCKCASRVLSVGDCNVH